MSHLLGEFECKLDTKGRLMIPAGLRKQMPEAEKDGLVVNRGFEKHLVIYGRKEWDGIMEDLSKLNPFEEKNRQFIRYFMRGATDLSLDAAGRILLPKSLLDYAGVNADVTLSSQFNKIELWAKDAYDAQLDNVPENFSKLAQEVMGNAERKRVDV
ncbi:Cell division protein MraZ [Arcticibacter svalbardensis MN12-7]|uniref:Transcriptional regulator MraZ n=1 Tax=Arcticibacter svalbardensis MN12-7 TaxID=1150600 RepID=R9GYU5_9SPHI|nr:division/cell wall cluster transcriptional repressor MraZ [Arcticibacter svalbardensis]EOR94134.1 Cell division protein MraZ [Arcticibacter svalbardensis MN12-7]